MMMKFKVFEMTPEWIRAENGATCIFLYEQEGANCFEAIREASIKYPDKPLRVTGGGYSVEHKEGCYAVH